jgi:hypothetical protein
LILVSSPCLATAQVAPPHLDILSAAVRAVPPIDPTAVGPRTVVVELTLAGAPVCGPAGPPLAYGIFVDTDRDPNTGLADPAFAPLGVDALVAAECDPGTGLFTSSAGAAFVGPGPGGATVVAITTTVADLPAVEFEWVAFSLDDTDMTRLPASPSAAAWGIIERRIP